MDQHLQSIFFWPIKRTPSADSYHVHLLVSSKSATYPPQKSSSLTRVKKQCQHMPPSFGIIYFVPKLLQLAFKAIPRTLCIRLTPYDRVKLFFAPGLSPSACTNPTRRFTFRLFTYPDWAINITFRPCIGNKSPLATEPPHFFLQQKP